MMKVLDVTRMKRGARRLGAADRPARRAWPRRSPGTGPTRPRRTPNGEPPALVPTASPRRSAPMFRRGSRLRAPEAASTRARRRRRSSTALAGAATPGRCDAPGRRLLFINQYYWPDHASTAQHLTDLAESLAARGLRVPRPLCPGPLPAGRAAAPGASRSTTASTSTASPRRRWAGASTLARMTDYLSFYARRRGQGAAAAPVRRGRDADDAADHRPDRHAPAAAARGRGTSTGAWTSIPTPAWRSGGCRRATRWSAALCLAERLGLPPGRQGRRARPLHGRPDRAQAGPRRADRHDPGLEPARRDLPDRRASGNPLRESLGLDDTFVAMYSGNLGLAHSFDEFLEAARRLRDRADIVFLFVGDGPRLAEVRAAQRARRA